MKSNKIEKIILSKYFKKENGVSFNLLHNIKSLRRLQRRLWKLNSEDENQT